MNVDVNDQEKALRFYTESLVFTKQADFSQGPFRWLTVASPEEPEGTQLQLALNDNPAAKTYQQAMFKQGQAAAMFYTDDVQGDHQRMKARGAEFTTPPTDVTASKIAMLNDTCGNLIQVAQLAQSDERVRRRSGEGTALLYGSAGLREEGRLQPGAVSLAHGGLAPGPG